MLPLLALLAAGPAPLLVSSPKPGVFDLSLEEEPSAKFTLTVSPWPAPKGPVRAEVGLRCEQTLVHRVLTALEKYAEQPRTGAPAFKLEGPPFLPAVLNGSTMTIDRGASITINLKEAKATMVGLGPTALRQIEAVLRAPAKKSVPVARLDEVTKVAGPGAEALWSGRRGLLFREGDTVKLLEGGQVRVLGKKSLKPWMSGCATTGPCAVSDGRQKVVVFSDGRVDAVDLPVGNSLPADPNGKSLWQSPDGRWVGAQVDGDYDDYRQYLWFFDRKTKKPVFWAGAGDMSHQLVFTTWGSKGVLFSRTAPCRDEDTEVVQDAACLLDLDTKKLSPVGVPRRATVSPVTPDRSRRLTYASTSAVIEPFDGGTLVPVSATVTLEPRWISNGAALVNADPLETIDLEGKAQRVIEDHLQFGGGQIDGTFVWYQTAEGVFTARVNGL